MTIEIGEKRLDLSHPAVMAIVNVTPDSFYAGSRASGPGGLEAMVVKAARGGAAILDVGGYSSRPGAADVPAGEETERVLRGVEAAVRLAPQAVVSVDTFRSQVVRAVVERFGPVMVNDISGGGLDPEMIPVVAELGLPYVAMHMRGAPATMNDAPNLLYGDVAGEVLAWFAEKIAQCRRAGIRELIVDPGFGFSKDVRQNYILLKELHRLVGLGCPVLGGLSRKSMIWKPLGVDPDRALIGTAALNWELLRQGVSILRVHDVSEAVQVVKLFEIYSENDNDQRN